ncbi:hypothetical protein H7I76_05445 [Mycolicibacterium vaccae]|nr:hypothetical protein [Mycolicibacterium vaccae]
MHTHRVEVLDRAHHHDLVAVMGSFDHGVDGGGSPGAPRVRIRGFALWGSVGVKRKKRKPAVESEN